MTRQEEIKKAVDIQFPKVLGESTNEQALAASGFELRVKWADEHIKSPWISIEDDLPCNHKELLLITGHHTISVFIYKKGGAYGIDNMIIRNGKWEWEAWKEKYLYWMPPYLSYLNNRKLKYGTKRLYNRTAQSGTQK